jgi:hypothetical protein
MPNFAVILPAAGQTRRFRDKAYKKPFAPLGGPKEFVVARILTITKVLLIAPGR